MVKLRHNLLTFKDQCGHPPPHWKLRPPYRVVGFCSWYHHVVSHTPWRYISSAIRICFIIVVRQFPRPLIFRSPINKSSGVDISPCDYGGKACDKASCNDFLVSGRRRWNLCVARLLSLISVCVHCGQATSIEISVWTGMRLMHRLRSPYGQASGVEIEVRSPKSGHRRWDLRLTRHVADAAVPPAAQHGDKKISICCRTALRPAVIRTPASASTCVCVRLVTCSQHVIRIAASVIIRRPATDYLQVHKWGLKIATHPFQKTCRPKGRLCETSIRFSLEIMLLMFTAVG